MMHKLFSLIALLSATLPVKAQFDLTDHQHAFTFGIMAHTKGEGIDVNYIRNVESTMQTLWDFDFVSMRHPKQKSIYNANLPNPRPYVYGKLNRFYVLRAGYGRKVQLAERTSKNNIGLLLTASAGLSSGFTKPVYIDYASVDVNGVLTPVTVRYEPGNPEQQQRYIIGNASFSKGLNELKYYPGLYFKTGIDVEWGNYISDYKCIEIGMVVDYFPGRPDIMYQIKNKTVFSSFYISFALGKTN